MIEVEFDGSGRELAGLANPGPDPDQSFDGNPKVRIPFESQPNRVILGQQPGSGVAGRHRNPRYDEGKKNKTDNT